MRKIICVLALVGASSAWAKESVFFANLKNGQTISTEQLVKFGVKGMAIKPAGTMEKGTGHHHLIIDSEPVPQGTVVPMDDKHMHFGKGQTETMVKLDPGTHTLTLQFADGAHVSYGKEMSKTITVKVKAAKK